MNQQESIWSYDNAARRWYGFGRYYAMFPLQFATEAVEGLTSPDDLVLDPFCGRGNSLFVATVLGRPSFGVDINPIAWLFASVKLTPESNPDHLISRLNDIASACRIQDKRAEGCFESMAWSPNVRGFLRTARRELDWKHSITDRTLMAFITLHMQDKEGAGLSNRLWPTIACSPTYAVSWWTKNQLTKPPKVDPVALLTDKIKRRYRYGIPNGAKGDVVLDDARNNLRTRKQMQASLIVTSPPYRGVTDYWNDHWIRLWMLGYNMKKDWTRQARYENQEDYKKLILEVFQATKKHLKKDANILVRSDRRRSTEKTCIEALKSIWPSQDFLFRTSDAPNGGISVFHGRGGSRAREIDILIAGKGGIEWGVSHGFHKAKLV